MDTPMSDQDHFLTITDRFVQHFKQTRPFLTDKIDLADLRKDERGRGVGEYLVASFSGFSVCLYYLY